MAKLRLYLVNVGLRVPLFQLSTPPLGLLYLAGYLRERFDLEIRVANQKVENYSYTALAEDIVGFGADIVGLSALTPFGYALGEVSRRVREGLPKALIVLGGPHASSFCEKALEDTAADALVAGEGERAFERLIQEYFLGGRDLSLIPGLIWREKEGEIVRNSGAMPLIEDLDSLPFPAYDLIDLRKYWKLPSMPPIPRRRYISLLSSRGCPYQCIYCHRIFGKRFRTHSAERMVDEIAFFSKHYGVRDVEFVDDSFNIDGERVIRFSELLRKRGLDVKLAFSNALRGDVLTEETVDALCDAGMYFSSFALETGSPRLQRLIGKNLNIPKFLRGVELSAARGVFTNGFNMLGFPTETEEELQMTIDTVCGSALHNASFFTVTPFPNTALYEMVREHKPEALKNLSYDNSDFIRIFVNCTDLPDDVLFAYQRKANRQFFFNVNRIYRMVRDYPQRRRLFQYAPTMINRTMKGIFGGR
ncbi:MAG TPA: radical SAM protein [Candidatus Hydrogenedentes bacterium]|nr:radical SAM protein [Candidatus Hydrogenedentota bacterium]